MTLSTVVLEDLTYWILLGWHWLLGFMVGLSAGVAWGIRIYKKRILHHIDQESVIK